MRTTISSGGGGGGGSSRSIEVSLVLVVNHTRGGVDDQIVEGDEL